ncbi:MAG TPA: hypothetical protein PLV68_05050 [Ilumatobacteraceae bacterium]|nr:hypothetical protein [Ilumatobacteraceae bacterium]
MAELIDGLTDAHGSVANYVVTLGVRRSSIDSLRRRLIDAG